MRSQPVRLLLLVLAVSGAAALWAGRASATVPGVNGKIAMGGGSIATVLTNGTGYGWVTGGPYDYAPEWSPNGVSLVYESVVGGNRDIYRVDSDGSGRTAVAATPARETLPSWSPDGKEIVYTSDGDVVVKTLGTGATRRLTSTADEDAGAVFSPDGRTIAFTRGPAGATDIFAIDADGANVRRLTTASGDDAQPDFSPGGGRIVFASKRGGTSALYSMNADGSAQTRLSPQSADAYESPAWAPDGTKLVYVRSRGGVAAVWTMNADGTNETLVFRPSTAYPTPAWQARDVTPPVITIRTPVEGATYMLGEVVAADYACADGAGSGVTYCSGSVAKGRGIDTAWTGSRWFYVQAIDKAGNTAYIQRHYTVVAGPPGSARDQLNEVIMQLDSVRGLFDRPGGMTWMCTCDPYWFGRQTLLEAQGGLRYALAIDHWRGDGTLKPAGGDTLQELRFALTRLAWPDRRLGAETALQQAELIDVISAVAHTRFFEVWTSMGATAARRDYGMWRAERFLRDGDRDTHRIRATYFYLRAWGELLGR